jgi:hypothetical protein
MEGIRPFGFIARKAGEEVFRGASGELGFGRRYAWMTGTCRYGMPRSFANQATRDARERKTP